MEIVAAIILSMFVVVLLILAIGILHKGIRIVITQEMPKSEAPTPTELEQPALKDDKIEEYEDLFSAARSIQDLMLDRPEDYTSER